MKFDWFHLKEITINSSFDKRIRNDSKQFIFFFILHYFFHFFVFLLFFFHKASGQGNFTRSSMDGPSGYLAIPKDVLETRTSTQRFVFSFPVFFFLNFSSNFVCSLTNTSQRSSVNSTSSDGSRTSGFSSSNSTQVDQAFHQFLETDLQNNAEIVFYTEVSHWKDQTRINISPEMEKRAKEIYEKYLTGKVSLPISKGTMERLIVSFSQQDPKARMKPDIFDQAQIEGVFFFFFFKLCN